MQGGSNNEGYTMQLDGHVIDDPIVAAALRLLAIAQAVQREP